MRRMGACVMIFQAGKLRQGIRSDFPRLPHETVDSAFLLWREMSCHRVEAEGAGNGVEAKSEEPVRSDRSSTHRVLLTVLQFFLGPPKTS